MTISYLIHARTEAEAAALAALGWKCSDDHLMTHHNVYSLRYRWEGEGDPPLPESMKALAS